LLLTSLYSYKVKYMYRMLLSRIRVETRLSSLKHQLAIRGRGWSDELPEV
jgi:hypothetical protein